MKNVTKIAGLIAVGIISVILCVKRDGYFPLSPAAPVWATILLDLLLLAAILGSVRLAFIPFLKGLLGRIGRVIVRHPLAVLTVCCNILVLGSIVTLWFSAIPFKEIYQLDPGSLAVIAILALAAVNVPFVFRKPWLILAGILAAGVILYGYTMLSIPVNAKLADLMPIVIRQGQAFLTGQNIYQYYLLDNGALTQAVRQPGVMLAYLPAVAGNFDPRILSLIFQIIGGIVLLELSYSRFKRIRLDPKFALTAVLLAVYLLLPYRILRSDLYDPPYWLLLIVSLWALVRRRYLTWAVFNGLALATQIWGWIMLPFMLLYLWRLKFPQRIKLAATLLTLLTGGMILALFILPDPHAYLEHVFGFYDLESGQAEYPLVTVYLTPLVFNLGLGGFLKPIQLLACAITGGVAWFKLKNFKGLLLALCVVTLAFIQFNIISWAYMYLIILYLLIFYILWQDNESN